MFKWKHLRTWNKNLKVLHKAPELVSDSVLSEHCRYQAVVRWYSLSIALGS